MRQITVSKKSVRFEAAFHFASGAEECNPAMRVDIGRSYSVCNSAAIFIYEC